MMAAAARGLPTSHRHALSVLHSAPTQDSDTERQMDYVNNAAGRAVGREFVQSLGWQAVAAKGFTGLAAELGTSALAYAVATAVKDGRMTRIVRFDGTLPLAGSCSATTCPTCHRALSSGACLKASPECTMPDLSSIL